MQQENQEMQQKLFKAEQLIKAQEKLIESLELAVETNQERTEMFREILAYHVPKATPWTEWKRVYLPVYGKINSPPFSKN